MNKINNQILKRVGILLFLIALQLLYFPINQNMQGGITTYLPIDTHITLSPIWAIPYLLSILWWAGALIWAASKMEYIRFVRFSLCLTLTILISYVIYILFPTYVDRPKIVDQDFLSQLVMFIYGNDRPYNALPSGPTKQHAILDLITALILAFTCYKISVYLVKKAPID